MLVHAEHIHVPALQQAGGQCVKSTEVEICLDCMQSCAIFLQYPVACKKNLQAEQLSADLISQSIHKVLIRVDEANASELAHLIKLPFMQ